MATVRELVNVIGFKIKDDQLKKAEKKVKKFKKNLSLIGAVVGGAIISIGTATILAASDMEETANKFAVVFDGISDQAESTSESIRKNFGLSRKETKKYLSDTGDLLTGLGFTKDEALELSAEVTKLGVDLASFTNVQGGTSRSVEALTKGLLGEREMMKALGIAIGEADIKKFAEGQGLVFKDLSRVDKARITLQLAMKQSKNAIGDFQRSSQSFANQLRIAQAGISDMAVEVGSALLPAATKLINVFNGLMKTVFTGLLKDVMSLLAPILDNVGSVLDGLLKALLPVVSTLVKILVPVLDIIINLFMDILKPALELVNAVLKPMLEIIEMTAPIFQEVFGMFADLIREIITDILGDLIPVIQDLGEILVMVLELLMPILRPLIKIVAFLAIILIKAILLPIRLIIKIFVKGLGLIFMLLKPIIKILSAIFLPIIKLIGGAVEWLVDLFGSGFSWIMDLSLKFFDLIFGGAGKIIKFFDPIVKIFLLLIKIVQKLYVLFWKLIWSLIVKGFKFILKILKPVFDALKIIFDFFKAIFDQVSTFLTSTITGLIEGVVSFLDFIFAGLNKLIATLNDMKVLGQFEEIGPVETKNIMKDLAKTTPEKKTTNQISVQNNFDIGATDPQKTKQEIARSVPPFQLAIQKVVKESNL